MQRDIRASALYREAHAIHKALRQPGTGQISDVTEIHAAPDGQRAVFAGTLMDTLDGLPATRICQVNLVTGDTRLLTFGPNTDRLPKYSPDGRHVAFLSDRHKAGDFQLYLLDAASGTARPTTPVAGWVEYLCWSPDGRRILLGVADHGADVSGVQGAVTSKKVVETAHSWMPMVETGDEEHRRRRAWVYELATDRVRQVSGANDNIWEAVWCGNEALATVVSFGPAEGLWYSARLSLIKIGSGESRDFYTPQDQLGWPAASPSGDCLAVVEAFCSDRWIVAGDLRVIQTTTGEIHRVDTRGVDITYTEWRSDQKLLIAGHRGFETVIGLYDAPSRVFTEVWANSDLTTSGNYASISGYNDTGDCVLVGESFLRGPEIALIRRGTYSSVKSFDLNRSSYPKVITEPVIWRAPDGLEIQGWLLRPEGEKPVPLIMNVHGGPVFHWRPRWLGRSNVHILMLIKHGYAIFFPNPRGSSGRGQSFARQVLGEMGGADTDDYLSGIDHLVQQGIADPKRLGVTGLSYGGFMTSWLVTQDSRFAAAVSVSPVTNWVTEHLISNLSHWVSVFVADSYTNPCGKYFERSPITHAKKVKTPTLNICGALDRCTPPEEAVQFHSALMESGVKSVLLTYPEEGHGIRKLPAVVDYAARVVEWFQMHMPSNVAH